MSLRIAERAGRANPSTGAAGPGHGESGLPLELRLACWSAGQLVGVALVEGFLGRAAVKEEA
ncbi:hypothetical protein [Sorangium sp. So ce124]|uniref:hypothetical protein n=1 Tax=Sorangium sp. So ce124 TaxID=3133280 RepID=UPI003F61DB01